MVTKPSLGDNRSSRFLCICHPKCFPFNTKLLIYNRLRINIIGVLESCMILEKLEDFTSFLKNDTGVNNKHDRITCLLAKCVWNCSIQNEKISQFHINQMKQRLLVLLNQFWSITSPRQVCPSYSAKQLALDKTLTNCKASMVQVENARQCLHASSGENKLLRKCLILNGFYTLFST